MGGKHKKIKILYTIPNFDTAGSGKVLYDLARGLDKDVFDVHIACKHGKGLFFDEVKALGLPIHFIDATVPLRPYYNLFARIQPFKIFLEEQSIDIVHSWHWSSDWTEVLATRLSGARFIYTKKAMSWGNIHWKIRSFLSHFIITINDEMEHYFSYKKEQQLIPLGIDTIFYNPALFPKCRTTIFKIVTIANLVPVKGIEVLINAINELKSNVICLDIIGDDDNDYSCQLKELVLNYGLATQINFIGKQSDIRPYLAASDLFVIPTLDEGRKEGMPMALVEAMAMQTLVLGSDISGIKFVLKEFKELLFDANDVEMLSSKIQEMYDKSVEEREIVAKKLRHYCETHFSLNSFINAHETLYFKLAGKH